MMSSKMWMQQPGGPSPCRVCECFSRQKNAWPQFSQTCVLTGICLHKRFTLPRALKRCYTVYTSRQSRLTTSQKIQRHRPRNHYNDRSGLLDYLRIEHVPCCWYLGFILVAA
mmetsp:Transcript_36931/g.73073  ORF Transcript_36931/g.73073 Transcript_36931/m.73073 type:complete len:112 (-) Transcript_36931:391-726(-)